MQLQQKDATCKYVCMQALVEVEIAKIDISLDTTIQAARL